MEQRTRRIATVGLLLLVATVGVGFALTGGVGVSGTVTIDAPDGPDVDVITNGGELLLDGPAGDNTVEVTHDNGEIVLESTGDSQATVDTTEITGSYSRVTSIDATNDLTLTPEDKPAVTVGGGIDSVEFSSMAVDDGTRDFSYSASAAASVTVNDIGATSETVIAVAGDGTVLDQTTADSSGTATFSSLNSGSYDVTLATTSDPALSNPSPSGGETVSETPVDLSINVTDDDFNTSHGDTVTATAYDAGDDSEIGSTTLGNDGTATVTWDNPGLGENSYYWVVEDEYGNNVQSSEYIFRTPNQIEIRNESDPSSLITATGNAEVTFFEQDGESVVTRPVENGTVDLSGLPNSEYIIVVEIDGFETRQAIIEDITEQQTVYVLPESDDNVEVRFRLEDPTSQFTEASSRLFIEKPITRNGTTRHRVVAADEFGATGYQTALEQGQRYQLRVVSDTGEERTFSFTAEQSESVTLALSDIEFEFETDEGYRWDASLTESDNIRFAWEDDEGQTESVNVQVLNQTTREVVFEDTITGNGTTMYDVSDRDTNTTTWIVEWEATRGGDTFTGATNVGASQLPIPIPGVPDEALAVVGFGLTILMGGLFTSQNATIGAIATSLIAGLFWFIGWIPSTVSGILIALALFLAVIVHMISERSSAPGV